MEARFLRSGIKLLALAVVAVPGITQAANRSIEEVVVTAERKESSVQDTSISITAFTSDMMEDFGIRNQSDLQNMVPATTIQPYDSAIRGVGRNFRNLGGDPGVATYMNGIYSEDLYTATIGSFWDVERIEVLRGPQGTLYGRNAVGGAMNFLYKKPTDEFDFATKATIGSYGTQDFYGMVSGPIIADVLNARATVSSREHDGWVEERSGLGPDLDSGNETNVSLSLEWKVSDNMSVNLRSNKADVDRVMGGADGGGLVVLTGENTTPGGDGLRGYGRTTNFLRPVDVNQTTNPLASDFFNPAQELFTFTNPTTGAPITAQYAREGIEAADHPFNYGADITGRNPAECVFSDRENISGDDLCAFTNGLNVELFDQQGNQLEFAWDISEGLTFKYLFGYNDLLYERITDNDNIDSQAEDRQFYVNHEAEYVSHEMQLFWDVGDNLTFTSGIFFYDAVIDQRYDFYSSAQNSKFADPAYALDNFLAVAAPGAVPGDPPLTFLQAVPPVGFARPITLQDSRDLAAANNAPSGTFTFVTGTWLGDASLGTVPQGLSLSESYATDILSTNKTERDSFAAYTQGVWDINEQFTLTFGARYAKDELFGEENLARYSETQAIIGPALGTNLATVNIVRGAIDPATLQPTGLVKPWLEGVPITFGAYRQLEREDSKVTWRVNLDYNITDDTMVYGNVTTGYRGGGFNLAFFSQTPQFDPEELIAYELGYKTQLMNNQLQINASAYLYDYDSIHTSTEEACPPGFTSPEAVEANATSACSVVNSTTSIQAAPGADVQGFELEVLWLATDNLTVGGNMSWTDTEYTGSFIVIDGADPTTPNALYTDETNADRRQETKGQSLPQIPEYKLSAYASYGFDLGDAGKLEVLGNYSYIDDVYFSAFQNALDLAPAYDRIDLRATWTSASDVWTASAFVNNVQDEIGIRQILRGDEGEGFRRTAQVTEPRVYGVELSYALK